MLDEMLFNFDHDQRRSIAEKLMELANLAIIALFFGQLLSLQVDLQAAGVGLGLFVAGYLIAFSLMKGGERKCDRFPLLSGCC